MIRHISEIRRYIDCSKFTLDTNSVVLINTNAVIEIPKTDNINIHSL